MYNFQGFQFWLIELFSASSFPQFLPNPGTVFLSRLHKAPGTMGGMTAHFGAIMLEVIVINNNSSKSKQNTCSVSIVLGSLVCNALALLKGQLQIFQI